MHKQLFYISCCVCRFIERNELPTSYREQIVEFILQKTAGAVSMPAPSHNVDPFTGGGAYVPGGASGLPQPGGQRTNNADPFTGAGGYVPGTPMHIDSGMGCVWFSRNGDPDSRQACGSSKAQYNAALCNSLI